MTPEEGKKLWDESNSKSTDGYFQQHFTLKDGANLEFQPYSYIHESTQSYYQFNIFGRWIEFKFPTIKITLPHIKIIK